MLEDATGIMSQVIGMLVIFQEGPDRHLDDFGGFAFGYQGMLHDTMITLAANPYFKEENYNTTLVGAASALCSMGNLPVHLLVEEYRRKPDMQRYITSGLNMGDISSTCTSASAATRASAPGPGARSACAMATAGGQPLQRCGKCKFLHYCSRECQSLDWKEGEHGAPHKIICSALCKFFAAGILADGKSMAVFTQAYMNRTLLSKAWTVVEHMSF